ncbi:hypothetical protein DRQ11_07015 [candidate division KSB1 bacterium]|nr:type II secretion system protein [bacterium]RKY87140.1 MAG: hypothetical protein DRQ11_07015 [candidate division KSB1 bacterium]
MTSRTSIKNLHPNSERGFSLVELVFVIVFISIALTAILNTFSTSVSSSVDSEYVSLAVQLAEGKMEQIKSDKAGKGYSYLVAGNYPSENNPDGYSGFSRTVNITTYTNYKVVTVTVTHSDVPTVTLETIFTNY